MKRWGGLNPVRFDETELKTDLGKDNFIFVGSSCDMWAQDIPEEWIKKVIRKCNENYKNKYLFQTKNPKNIRRILPSNSHVCVTLETNRLYEDVMRNSPPPWERVDQMTLIRHPLYITIEPIMDFDLVDLIDMIYKAGPIQVNIGADSGNNDLSEPTKEDIMHLISRLEEFTTVKQKKNLNRLLK
jgi:DNA repair photolyase